MAHAPGPTGGGGGVPAAPGSPASPVRASRAPRVPYAYLPLADVAKHPPGRVNVYGVVSSCTAPRPTKGTGALCGGSKKKDALARSSHRSARALRPDWVVTLRLVDASSPTTPALGGRGVTYTPLDILVFGPPDALPSVDSAPGDVVRIHRAVVRARAARRGCAAWGGRPCAFFGRAQATDFFRARRWAGGIRSLGRSGRR